MLYEGPKTHSSHGLADWIELQLLLPDNSWTASEETVGKKITNCGYADFSPFCATAMRVMRQRAKRLGHLYPFEKRGHSYRKRTNFTFENCVYSTLLLLSHVDLSRGGKVTQQVGSIFEKICEPILKNLGGKDNKVLHFGWPSGSGRPEAFDRAILWLSEKLNTEPGNSERPKDRKDGGVDIVTWREGPYSESIDIRLVQCTIEENITKKHKEISLNEWSGWINFPELPKIALAVPHQIDPRSNPESETLINSGVVIVDRLWLSENGEDYVNTRIFRKHYLEVKKLADLQ